MTTSPREAKPLVSKPLVSEPPGCQKSWSPYQVGQAVVELGGGSQKSERVCLHKYPQAADDESLTYANAQIDDYHHLRRRDFFWKPPLRLTLRARFSHPAADPTARATPTDLHPFLTGTAGFGFWNDPFMMTGHRRPTLPRALWFFYSSPPSDMRLALDVPGWGWKAAVIDCLRPGFCALLPTAPAAVLLMRSRLLYRKLWPIAQNVMNVDEQLIELSLTEWRLYEIEWRPSGVRFWIDDELVFQTAKAPRGPLGLVVWLDNQSMVVTPTGLIRSGLVPTTKNETLEIEDLQITSGE